MKLYRSKIPLIAAECIDVLARDGDIELAPNGRDEAVADIQAIMDDYQRRDGDLREEIRDKMARDALSYEREIVLIFIFSRACYKVGMVSVRYRLYRIVSNKLL